MTNFLISVFAEKFELAAFIASGALFQSLVASPMNEFTIRFDEPSSMIFPFVILNIAYSQIIKCMRHLLKIREMHTD